MNKNLRVSSIYVFNDNHNLFNRFECVFGMYVFWIKILTLDFENLNGTQCLTSRQSLPASESLTAHLSWQTSLLSLSLSLFHSNKLDHFASIRQNVTEKAILTLLGQRSTSLIIAFPSSATSPPRAHTPTQPSGKPSGVCECVWTREWAALEGNTISNPASL